MKPNGDFAPSRLRHGGFLYSLWFHQITPLSMMTRATSMSCARDVHASSKSNWYCTVGCYFTLYNRTYGRYELHCKVLTELSAACPNILHTHWLKILQSTAKIAISCWYSNFWLAMSFKWSPRPLLPSQPYFSHNYLSIYSNSHSCQVTPFALFLHLCPRVTYVNVMFE